MLLFPFPSLPSPPLPYRSEGMTLFLAGGVSSRMLVLIRSGKVEVRSSRPPHKELFTAIAGDFVGDFHMLFGTAVEHTVVCSVFTEVAVLRYDSVVQVVDYIGRLNGESSCLSLNNFQRRSRDIASDCSCQQLGASPTGSRADGLEDLSLNEGDKEAEKNTDDDDDDEEEEVEDKNKNKSSLTNKKGDTTIGNMPFSAGVDSSAAVAANDGSNKSSHNGYGYSVYADALLATLAAHQSQAERLAKAQSQLYGVTSSPSKNKKLQAMMESSVTEMNVELAPWYDRVIMPDRPFVVVWEAAVLLSVLYYNLAIPLRVIFRLNCDDSTGGGTLFVRQCLGWHWSLVLDYAVDAVFVVDTLLRARYFAFRRFAGEYEVVETSKEAIWDNFRHSSRFYINLALVGSVVFDLSAIWVGRLLLLRLCKVVSWLLVSSTLTNAQEWLDKERNYFVPPEMLLDAQLALLTILMSLWISAIWLVMFFGGDSREFVSSVYWCFTALTTTGYGDIVPENTGQTVGVRLC